MSGALAVRRQKPADTFTLPEFERWLQQSQPAVCRWPYEIPTCDCGDVNCKGWRLAAPRGSK